MNYEQVEKLINTLLDGVYDDPDLMDYGFLDWNPSSDVLRMINRAWITDTERQTLKDKYIK
jgi:hypothetical protein